ncbi:MAG: winged helix-turn-helix transcriptional regulator [Candidatus Dormibacteria bacterium]
MPLTEPAQGAGRAGSAGDRVGRGLEDALARVGDRWTLLVVSALLGQPRRFGDLLVAIPGLAPNILSARLKHLDREGLVVSTPYCRRPVRLVYNLSATGAELAGALRLLAQWGSGDGADPVRHDACGTVMEARWFCPSCTCVGGPASEGDEEVYLL